MAFTEIKGMKELSDGKPRRIRNCKVCKLTLFSLHTHAVIYNPTF